MRNLLTFTLNLFFIIFVIVIAVGVSTLALAKKVDDYNNQYDQSLSGSVVKHALPVMSFTKGIVNQIKTQTGTEVKANDVLVVLINPSLQSELSALKQFPTNESAVTQSKVDEQLVKSLTITAPADGIVGDIAASEGSTVDEFTKLLTIYSNKNIQFLANLTVDQYQAVRHASKVEVYSRRLNQSFVVIPSILNPDEKMPLSFDQKKIGLYFTFQNQQDAASLLNNEDLSIILSNTQSTSVNKPIDFIVNFWNKILGSH